MFDLARKEDRDQRQVDNMPLVSAITQSNTCMSTITNEPESRGGTFYMANYMSKLSNKVMACLPILLTTVRQMKVRKLRKIDGMHEKDDKGWTKFFSSRILNRLNGNNEYSTQ